MMYDECAQRSAARGGRLFNKSCKQAEFTIKADIFKCAVHYFMTLLSLLVQLVLLLLIFNNSRKLVRNGLVHGIFYNSTLLFRCKKIIICEVNILEKADY